MKWRGIELKRDGQGWRAVTDDGVFLLVIAHLSRWQARLDTSYGSAVSGYGTTPEAAMAECDAQCREMAAELLRGLS